MSEKITLEGISAIKIILSQYTKHNKKVEEYESQDGDLPLTIISTEYEDVTKKDKSHERAKKAYYFLDSKKNQMKLWPNFIDISTNGHLPPSTTKLCWWDRHSFQNRPIGCPLRYYKKEDKEIYETEGIFCSFSCCKSYIIDRNSNVKYKDSLSILSSLFMILSQDKSHYILPSAPSWKLLKEYGGHLSIQEYRASVGNLEYEDTINIKRCMILSSSQYTQEKRYTPKPLKKKE